MQLSNFVHKTLWLMTTYHQTKFGCQGINNSEVIVESHFDHMSPCCDLDLEESKTFFLHVTLAHNDASPYEDL